jgi:hypothetical protein
MNYDFDINKASIEILPPDKRYKNNITLIQSLLSSLQWARDLFFSSYYEGSTADDYSAGTYNFLDQVKYNKKIYSSLIDSNTDAPTTDNWILVQDNFIGVKERVKYNGGKLVLEYALNKEFDTTFRQPANVSDIYITNLNPESVGFIVGEDEAHSSYVSEDTSEKPIVFNLPFAYVKNFQINVPSAVYAGIASTDTRRNSSIRNFVNQYIPSGLNYLISTY